MRPQRKVVQQQQQQQQLRPPQIETTAPDRLRDTSSNVPNPAQGFSISVFNKHGGYNINNVNDPARFPNFHNQISEQRKDAGAIQGTFYPVGGRRSSLRQDTPQRLRDISLNVPKRRGILSEQLEGPRRSKRPRIRKRILRKRGRNPG